MKKNGKTQSWRSNIKEENLISFDEMRQREYEILCNVAEFCEQNNLRYFLAYGTLLGAVRHAGFIPWDDDIDIMMPRPDYEKFLNTYNSWEGGKYESVDGRNSRNITLFAKVHDNSTIKLEHWRDYGSREPLGIDIDVFPLDGFSESEEKNSALIKKAGILNEIYLLCEQFPCKTPKRRFAQRFIKLIGRRFWYTITNKLSQKYSYEDSEKVGLIVRIFTAFKFKNMYRKEVFKEAVFMRFQERDFSVPVGYDEYLRIQYGKYMQLPPENKRVSEHDYVCYIKK